MHHGIIRQTLLVLYFLLSNNGVQGRTKISKLENAELEKQLKLLNKPTAKIVKSKYGDVYSCVDFYKQPAFDHPLLKNHDFHPQMKPMLVRSKKNSSTSANNWSSKIWSKDGGCPFGTVPIERITKDDLIRYRNMPSPEDVIHDTELTTISNDTVSKRSKSQGYKLAIVRINKDPNNKFAGAGMVAGLYNPHVKGQQNSACRMKIQKGTDILQVGWRVDPILYRDNRTRLFVHFQAGTRRCFNVLCPGFVLVNNKIPIDMAFEKITHRGAKISWEYTMYIDRDLASGNWWLLVEESYEQIGFWPQKIFTSLAGFADNVDWGGVAYSPPGVPEPPMGSGFFPIGQSVYDGYCGKLTVLNDKGVTTDVLKMTEYADDPNLYRVMDSPEPKKHYMFYGGPGDSQQVQV